MIEELFPSIEVIDKVINEAVAPILNQLEHDLGKLNYKCFVFVGDKEEYSRMISYGNRQSNYNNFQPIRIRFCKIFQPNKLRYHIESIISKEFSPEGTGYSGFSTDGSINIDDLTIKKLSWVARYNAWDWKGWKF